MTEHKTAATFRLTDDAIELCVMLARKLGSNKTNVVELAIRRLAELERVTVPIDAVKPKRTKTK